MIHSPNAQRVYERLRKSVLHHDPDATGRAPFHLAQLAYALTEIEADSSTPAEVTRIGLDILRDAATAEVLEELARARAIIVGSDDRWEPPGWVDLNEHVKGFPLVLLKDGFTARLRAQVEHIVGRLVRPIAAALVPQVRPPR